MISKSISVSQKVSCKNGKVNSFKQKFNITMSPFFKQYSCLNANLIDMESDKKFLQYKQLKEYQIIEQIGEVKKCLFVDDFKGAHSVVKKVQNEKGEIFVAKIIQRAEDEEIIFIAKVITDYYFKLIENNRKNFKFQEQQIIQYYQNLQQFAIIQEYFNGDPLQSFKDVQEKEIKSIMRQLLTAIKYLHEQKIAHRDISITNVLYNRKTDELKLIDFGCAKKLKQTSDFLCTPQQSWFSAPEQSEGGIYNEKVDIWSTGHVLLYLVTQKKISKQKLYKIVSLNKLNRFKIEDAELNNLLNQLLLIDAQTRISASEALLHKYFQN